MGISETLKGRDYLILSINLFVESGIDLALKSAVWQLLTFTILKPLMYIIGHGNSSNISVVLFSNF